MATVRDVRLWLASMGEDFIVYTDHNGDLCCDNGEVRQSTHRLYPDTDDTRHPSWYWCNVLARGGRAMRPLPDCVLPKEVSDG
jgi:hypothetical protein